MVSAEASVVTLDFRQEQSELLEMVASTASLTEILDRLARSVETQLPGMLCSVLLLEEGDVVRHAAAPSLPPAFLEAIDGLPIGPCAGSCGTAMFRREPVIVSDLDTDPLWADYREFVAPYGLRACWSTPLLSPDGKVLGSFALYYCEPRSPTARETRLTELATHIAALAIEHKRSEAALRQSEALLHSIIDNSPAAISAKDRDGRYILVNRVFELRSGRRRDELLGKRDGELFAPEVARLQESTDRAVLEAGGPLHFEDSVLQADGLRSLLVLKFPIAVNGKPGAAVCGVVSDVTERQRLQERSLELQKMEGIGRLAGGVAHDFNNILTTIVTTAELLEQDLGEKSPFQADVQQIRRAADRAASLTRELLVFARKGVVDAKVLDWGQLLAESEGLLRHLLGPEIELRCTGAAAPAAFVRADRSRLQQLLLNLASNAREAMPTGGSLKIHLECGQALGAVGRSTGSPVARLTVEDTGVGMDAYTREHVFEPFFTTKERGKQNGLGLATCYGIVDQCGGRIECESTPGHGTRFVVELPLQGEQDETPSPEIRRAPAPGAGRTILLVEDEPHVRSAAARVLRGAGFRVVEAPDGVEALRLAEEEPQVALLLTDVVMPRMSGLKLAERLRRDRPDLPILFTSGFTDDPALRGGAEGRNKGFLHKPYSAASLVEHVHAALSEAATPGAAASEA